jgi:hypothetical protein
VSTRETEDVWDDLKATARAILHGVAAHRSTITYRELTDRLGVSLPANDEWSLARLLREVSTEEDEAGRGLLTAVVVRHSGGLPGGGFFRMAAARGRDVDDRQSCWERELERVYRAYSDV